MSLTKKQRKQIKDAAGSEDVATIAARLGLSPAEVSSFLGGLARERSSGEGAGLMESPVGKVLGLALVVLVGLAPLVFLSGLSDFANLPQSAFILAGTLVCCLLWLGPGFFGRGLVLSRSPLALPLLAFLSWAALSALLAHNTFEALTTLSYWVPAGLVYAVTHHAAAAKPLRRHLLLAMFLAGLAASLLGIAQYLFGFDGVPQVVPPAGTFANKNAAVHVLVLTWPLGLFLLLRPRSRFTALAAACGTGTMLLYLIYTGTRAGWLAFLAQVLLLFVFLWRERCRLSVFPVWNRGTGIAAVAIFALFLSMLNFGPQGFTNGFARIFGRAKTVVESLFVPREGRRDTSVALRLAVWRNTLVMVRDRPILGFGIGNHKVFYPIYRDRAVKDLEFSEGEKLDHVHNDALQVAAEIGLPGLALLLWLVAALGRTVLYGRHSADLDVRLVSALVAVTTAGLIVNALFDFPLQRAVPPLLLLAQWGVLTAAIPGPARREKRVPGRVLPGVLAGGVFLALALLLRHQGRAMAADRHILAAKEYETASQWEDLLQEGRKALLLDPSQTQVFCYTGRALVELGRNREAIADLQKGIADYPYQMNALLNLCTAHENLGEHDQALQACGRVLAIKSDYAKAHNNIGSIYMNRGDLDRALSSYRTAATLSPEDAFIQFNLGNAAMKRGLYEEAAAAFARAAEARPGSALAQKNLGMLLVQFLNRPEEGVQHLREALRLNPRISGADRIRKIVEGYDGGALPAEMLSRGLN